MAHPDFPCLDQLGIVRNYKIEDDYIVSAKQAEEAIEKLLYRIKVLEELLREED